MNTAKILTIGFTLIYSFISTFPITEDRLGDKHANAEIKIFNRSDLNELEQLGGGQ